MNVDFRFITSHEPIMFRAAACLLLSLVVLSSTNATLLAVEDATSPSVRFATYNCSFHRKRAGDLIADLATPGHEQASKVAAIIQHVRPDVLLLNEFDFDPEGLAVKMFEKNYLGKGQFGQQPIHYEYRFLAPVNTGVPSRRDLNGDGVVKGPQDAFGFGEHPGQYGMVVLSRFAIDVDHARTFQKFLWKDMPGAKFPEDPAIGKPWLSDDALGVFRLSSKSHWDLPVTIKHAGEATSRTIHFLVSHPTPPVFDGDEDRNGKRNHDEIRFWADYVDPARSSYIYDDVGQRGGLAANANFVIAGDQNADPFDGDSTDQAILQLTQHKLINNNVVPASAGAVVASERQGGINASHKGESKYDTSDFNDRTVGNMRIDYVLPAKTLKLQRARVFWPKPNDVGFDWIDASDHRLVWIDIATASPD